MLFRYHWRTRFSPHITHARTTILFFCFLSLRSGRGHGCLMFCFCTILIAPNSNVSPFSHTHSVYPTDLTLALLIGPPRNIRGVVVPIVNAGS
uniref:Putative secreted protein n=1 Tax=Anopheles darlingi TaxID=43151 RepID=A0A2M4DCC5_ANODA